MPKPYFRNKNTITSQGSGLVFKAYELDFVPFHTASVRIAKSLADKQPTRDCLKAFLDKLLEEPCCKLLVSDTKSDKFFTYHIVNTSEKLLYKCSVTSEGNHLSIFGQDKSLVLKKRAEIQEMIDKLTVDDPGILKTQVCYTGTYGVNYHTINVKIEPFSAIEMNYSKKVREQVKQVIACNFTGKLLIWNGPPGTGKTYAIRSLMTEWKDKYDFVTVTDPEAILSNPSYYYSIVEDYEEKPVVLVLEDAADSLLAENRSAFGDRVSKLLNITDGIIGQGRNDLIMVTFNEIIDRLDPAIIRPGRCGSIIEFDKFDPYEVLEWCRLNECKAPVNNKEKMSLAELYAHKRGDVGFGEKDKKAGFTS